MSKANGHGPGPIPIPVAPALWPHDSVPLARHVWPVRDVLKLQGPAEAIQFVRRVVLPEGECFEQEELYVVLVTVKSQPTHVVMVYRGSVSSVPIRIADLFREAVRVNAASIIVAHCHPSGDPAPSPDDVRVTREAVAAGKLLGIEVLDHVIVAGRRFVSMRERGLGF